MADKAKKTRWQVSIEKSLLELLSGCAGFGEAIVKLRGRVDSLEKSAVTDTATSVAVDLSSDDMDKLKVVPALLNGQLVRLVVVKDN